jgi:hypothetical protein
MAIPIRPPSEVSVTPEIFCGVMVPGVMRVRTPGRWVVKISPLGRKTISQGVSRPVATNWGRVEPVDGAEVSDNDGDGNVLAEEVLRSGLLQPAKNIQQESKIIIGFLVMIYYSITIY